MQGPSHLDLAKTLAEEHLRNTHGYDSPLPSPATSTMRAWVGQRLITLGERMAPRPTELQLKVSTGPPCP